MSRGFYSVYIACMTRDAGGLLTKDYLIAKQLYRKLEQKGIHTFLTERCRPDDRTDAIDSAAVLIVVGTCAEALLSDTVRGDYEDFIAGVELSGRQGWRVFSYLRGMTPDELPDYLTRHRSYDYYNTNRLVNKIEKTLSAEKPKACISDDYDPIEDNSFGDMEELLPACLPDSAESAREYIDDDDDDDDDIPVCRPGRARRAPAALSDEMRVEEESAPESDSPASEPFSGSSPAGQSPITPVPPAPFPPMPEPGKSKPVKIKPARINKVDFSVVAPDEVRPGKSSVIDLLMYTRSQRSIVKRTLEQAKEKSSEAARSAGSVSVKQGSRVTALLFSDDIEITDSERSMIWNGDALDFKFRVTPPEDYAGKEIDFGCCMQFDGIEITRLYFTVAVGSKKKVAVRFTRKDCRRAFVSYSHKDRLRVAEQLLAIQEVAPKLRFWMDNRSMTAGDMWRNAIASAIRNADVFLLFWSVSARESSEVRKEWEYALQLEQSGRRGAKRGKRGMRFISPVPLDNPSDCPPPEELSDLHFGDPSFDSDIGNIEKVRVWAVRGKNIKLL